MNKGKRYTQQLMDKAIRQIAKRDDSITETVERLA